MTVEPITIRPESSLEEAELIYDWNSVEKVAPLSPKRRFTFMDETLRDGIQSPSVVDPTIEDAGGCAPRSAPALALRDVGERGKPGSARLAESCRQLIVPIGEVVAAQLHRGEAEPAIDEMDVRVDEAGNEHASPAIDHPRPRGRHLPDRRAGSD